MRARSIGINRGSNRSSQASHKRQSAIGRNTTKSTTQTRLRSSTLLASSSEDENLDVEASFGDEVRGFIGSTLGKRILLGVATLLVGLLGIFSVKIVGPGHRGIRTTFGGLTEEALKEGLNFKLPIFGSIDQVSIQQRTDLVDTACYSKDLQQVKMKLSILWKIPESAVVKLYEEHAAFKGEDPIPFETLFQSLIQPRVNEALKETIGQKGAIEAAENRELVRITTKDKIQAKIGTDITIVDITIDRMTLTPVLQTAIDQKMVREQRAEQATYERQRALTDAETKVFDAFGTAKGMVLESVTLQKNPDYVRLLLTEKWNGESPRVISESSTDVVVPLPKK